MTEHDMERTQQAIMQSTGGNSLDPLVMLYNDVENCFKLIGNKGAEITKIKEVDATQTNEIDTLKAQMKTLQNRLWGLLAGGILAVAGAGATWLFS